MSQGAFKRQTKIIFQWAISINMIFFSFMNIQMCFALQTSGIFLIRQDYSFNSQGEQYSNCLCVLSQWPVQIYHWLRESKCSLWNSLHKLSDVWMCNVKTQWWMRTDIKQHQVAGIIHYPTYNTGGSLKTFQSLIALYCTMSTSISWQWRR